MKIKTLVLCLPFPNCVFGHSTLSASCTEAELTPQVFTKMNNILSL
jgi:hypothetical protein